MPIDWIWGLIGGALIGSAAAVFLLVNGRIMGASGLIGGLVDGTGRSNWSERASLIAGLVLVPAIIAWARGGAETHLTSNLIVIVAAGLMVGLGTRIANGCTVCYGRRDHPDGYRMAANAPSHANLGWRLPLAA